MIDAHERNGDDVAVTNIRTDYWSPKLFDFRRLPALVAATGVAKPPATLRGIDVASHQGAVDWAAVAASGVAFSATKATGGTWYRNPTFAANWLGMQAAGLVRGAYHFAFESSGQAFPGDGPEAEADYFVAELRRAGGIVAGDLLVLDIEDGQGALGDWALRWLRRVEATTGAHPLLYSGAWFTDPHGFAAVPALADYPLWLADYGAEWPDAPAPWKATAIWQYSDKGVVPGVAGSVDLNQFAGTVGQLRALGSGGPAPAPVPAYHYVKSGDVGSGLLDLMAAQGTEPALPSVFLPLGRSPALIEECQGMDGRIYRWHIPTGRSWRYEPSA